MIAGLYLKKRCRGQQPPRNVLLASAPIPRTGVYQTGQTCSLGHSVRLCAFVCAVEPKSAHWVNSIPVTCGTGVVLGFAHAALQ